LALGGMDKFIYRGILILVCLMLTIVLIVSPIMIMMWIKIQKAEIRIERKEKQINQQLRELREK
jgi:cell division protein FtsL